jgi:hypothetical protein
VEKCGFNGGKGMKCGSLRKLVDISTLELREDN